MAELTDDLTEGLENVTAASEELVDTLKTMMSSIKKSSGATDKESAKRTKSANDFDSLNAAMRDSTDEQEAYSNVVAASGAVWDTMTGAVDTAAQVLTGMASDLLGGEGFGMFRKLIDPISSLIEGMGTVLGDVVGGFIKLGGDLPIVGGALDSMGELASGAGDALGKVASAAFKFIAEMTLDSVEQLWNMFEGAASAGLLVTGGMTTMRENAEALNLTTQEYTKLIQSQAANMTTFGGTVADGAKKLTAVANASAEHNIQLRRLGISYEEQYERTSEFMESLARTGQLRAMNDRQIADASFDYMKNLKVVSALTGKSADDMKKDRDAALKNLAFQAKLAKMDPAVRTEMEAALGAMPEGMQQAFKESVIFGKVMTDTGAIVSGAAPIIEKFANSISTGSANFDQGFQLFRDDMKNAAPELRANMSNLAAAGMAALVGKGSNVSNAIDQFGTTLFTVLGQVEAGTKFDVDQAKTAGERAGAAVDNVTKTFDTQRLLMQKILQEADSMLPAVTKGMEAMMSKGVSIFDTMKEDLSEGGDYDIGSMMDGAKTKISSVMDNIQGWVKTAMNTTTDAMSEFGIMLDSIKNSSTYQVLFGEAATPSASPNAVEGFVPGGPAVQSENLADYTQQNMARMTNKMNDALQFQIDKLTAEQGKLNNQKDEDYTTADYIRNGFDDKNEQLTEIAELLKELKGEQMKNTNALGKQTQVLASQN